MLLTIVLISACCGRRTSTSFSRLDQPLEQRLDLPQRVASVPLRLTDFVSFIATSFKVPLLVETTAPVPDLRTPEGTYSARQLLDLATRQLSGFEWKDEAGVAHIYQNRLAASSGNILNIRIRHYAFPADVGEFMYYFRPCIRATIQGYDCSGGAYSGFQLPKLERGRLPLSENFNDFPARDILLAALRENGRFYVLIAFEGTEPSIKSDYPFANWFSESLEVARPSPLWVQNPKHRVR